MHVVFSFASQIYLSKVWYLAEINAASTFHSLTGLFQHHQNGRSVSMAGNERHQDEFDEIPSMGPHVSSKLLSDANQGVLQPPPSLQVSQDEFLGMVERVREGKFETFSTLPLQRILDQHMNHKMQTVGL